MSSPVITPNSAILRGKQTQLFSAGIQSVDWTVTRGTLSSAHGTQTTYTAPNRTGTYVLTANNGVDPVTQATIKVTGVFPLPLTWEYDEEADKKVLLWQPQIGPWQANIKRGQKRKINLQCGPRPASQYPELDQFWDDHYGREDFILVHPDRGVEITVRADSMQKVTWKHGLFRFSAVVVEV